MDASNLAILTRMINSYIEILDNMSTQNEVFFLSNGENRKALNILLTENVNPSDEKSLAQFDVNPILLSRVKVQTILQRAVILVNFDICLFGLLMADELFSESGHQEEDRRRRELIIAIFPLAKNLNGNILALY